MDDTGTSSPPLASRPLRSIESVDDDFSNAADTPRDRPLATTLPTVRSLDPLERNSRRWSVSTTRPRLAPMIVAFRLGPSHRNTWSVTSTTCSSTRTPPFALDVARPPPPFPLTRTVASACRPREYRCPAGRARYQV